jgi:hypothetical protein
MILDGVPSDPSWYDNTLLPSHVCRALTVLRGLGHELKPLSGDVRDDILRDCDCCCSNHFPLQRHHVSSPCQFQEHMRWDTWLCRDYKSLPGERVRKPRDSSKPQCIHKEPSQMGLTSRCRILRYIELSNRINLHAPNQTGSYNNIVLRKRTRGFLLQGSDGFLNFRPETRQSITGGLRNG